MVTSYDGDEPCNTLILDFKTLRASWGRWARQTHAHALAHFKNVGIGTRLQNLPLQSYYSYVFSKDVQLVTLTAPGRKMRLARPNDGLAPSPPPSSTKCRGCRPCDIWNTVRQGK